MNRLKKPKIRLLLPAVLFMLLLYFGAPCYAINGFIPGEVCGFATDTETTYSTTRAKTVTFGDFSWKITDADGFTTGPDGLMTDGTVALTKSNPVNGAEGFRIEITYSVVSEDGAADAGTAFLTMSSSGFGTSVPMVSPTTVIGIAENGDVYLMGKKINHASGAKAEDILTAKSTEIASGEECCLALQYAEGELSVFLSHGEKKITLVDHYPCGVLAGLRQMQLGGDNNAEKRIVNAAYKTVSFATYGEYVPHLTESLQAVLKKGDDIKEYESLDRALIDAKESAHNKKRTVLKLYTDLKLAHPLEVQSGWDLTLDLNGYIVDRGQAGKMASDGYVITIQKDGKLTIEDSAPESTRYSTTIRGGVITGGAGSSVGGGILLNTDAVLIMNGGSIAGCVTDEHGGAIRVNGDNARITIAHAGFYGNRTYESSDNCHGGAVFGDKNCEITVTDTVFEGNYSEDNGGAIYMNGGKLLADNCIFSGNKALDDGGAVYIERGAYAVLDNCRFYDNRSDGAGGAAYCNSSEGTRLTGKFFGNTAGKDGGAVFVNGDAVCLADAEVSGNSAAGSGSGVYVDEMYDLNVQGLLLVRNNTSTKNVRDDIFLDNTIYASAHIYDGGLYDGSEVFVRADDKGHTVIENVSEYQAGFFKSDNPDRKTVFKEDRTRPEFYSLVTSAVGEGDKAFIVTCTLLIAAFIVFLIVYQRKKGKGADKK